MVLGVLGWTKRTAGGMRLGGGGVERLLTRFDRFDVDLGMSAERWASRDVTCSGAVNGGMGSGFVRSRNVPEMWSISSVR